MADASDQEPHLSPSQSAASSPHLIAHITREVSGPLPPPEVLAGYKAIDPGLVDRIVAMAEKGLDRQFEIDRAALDADVADTRAFRMEVRWGQCFAFAVAVLGLAGSFYAVIHGYPTSGTVIAGGTLASLVGTFLYRERRHGSEGDFVSVKPRTPAP